RHPRLPYPGSPKTTSALPAARAASATQRPGRRCSGGERPRELARCSVRRRSGSADPPWSAIVLQARARAAARPPSTARARAPRRRSAPPRRRSAPASSEQAFTNVYPRGLARSKRPSGFAHVGAVLLEVSTTILPSLFDLGRGLLALLGCQNACRFDEAL